MSLDKIMLYLKQQSTGISMSPKNIVEERLTSLQIQSNFNGSNTFGTLKICLRQGQFELMSVNHSARSGGNIGISFLYSLKVGSCCFECIIVLLVYFINCRKALFTRKCVSFSKMYRVKRISLAVMLGIP